MVDEFLHKGKAGRLAVLDEQDPLKLAGDGHDAVMNTVRFVVQLNDVVGLLVAQKREGMPLVHDLRAEHGEQLPLEIGFPEMLLFLAQMGEIHLAVALLGQRIHKMLIIFVTFALQLRHPRRDGGDLLRGGHVGDHIGLVALEQRLVIERADPHHEKFVHVVGEDGGKLDALPQRHGLVLGEGQHTAVKVQPAQFPVDKNTVLRFHTRFLPVDSLIANYTTSP